jgi:hypothetical protein
MQSCAISRSPDGRSSEWPHSEERAPILSVLLHYLFCLFALFWFVCLFVCLLVWLACSLACLACLACSFRLHFPMQAAA